METVVAAVGESSQQDLSNTPIPPQGDGNDIQKKYGYTLKCPTPQFPRKGMETILGLYIDRVYGNEGPTPQFPRKGMETWLTSQIRVGLKHPNSPARGWKRRPKERHIFIRVMFFITSNTPIPPQGDGN